MRFYGNGVVWDAENDKRLCKFSRAARGEKGVFETDDKRICSELIRLGYAHEGDMPETKDTHCVARVVCSDCGHEWVAVFPDETPISTLECPQCGKQNAKELTEPNEKPESITADLGVKKLREIGKEIGLSFPASTTKTDMAKAINEAKK